MDKCLSNLANFAKRKIMLPNFLTVARKYNVQGGSLYVICKYINVYFEKSCFCFIIILQNVCDIMI